MYSDPELQKVGVSIPGMLIILVKTIVNTSNNALAKSIADTTTTNTAVEKYCQYQYQYFCDNTFHCLLHSTTFIFCTVICSVVMDSEADTESAEPNPRIPRIFLEPSITEI